MKNQELLKIYSAYLPYGVKVISSLGICVEMRLSGFRYHLSEGHELCLRPLSDLTKEIEHNGEKFVPVDKIEEIFQCDASDEYLISAIMHNGSIEIRYYQEFQKLLEWHFDIFGLIPQNLAINLNEIK